MDDLKKLLENAGVVEVRSDPNQYESYEVQDDHGNTYRIDFEDRHGVDAMFVEANGVTIAYGEIGGGGTMQASIKKPDEVLEALLAFAEAIR